MATRACYLGQMHKLIIAAFMIASAGPASAETVYPNPTRPDHRLDERG